MAIVFNTTTEPVSIKVFGNWFAFKPKQMKTMDEKFAAFIAVEKQESGLVSLPPEFEDPEYKGTLEGRKVLSEFEEQGIRAYIDFYRRVIYNNQVSLRQDLEKANLKVDPAALASDGELRAMQIVAKYQRSQHDHEQAKIAEVGKLMEQVGKLDK